MTEASEPDTTVPLRITGPGDAITGVWTWFCAAPPKKGERQWKAGRSAMELANAWCRGVTPAPPREMLDALDSHPDTAGFVAWDATAELTTPLDAQRGETRNHDLVVCGHANGTPVLVAVEAKAGERFGDCTLEQQLAAGLAKGGSGLPRRIALLVQALTGRALDLGRGDPLPPELAPRGYQLFTAAVGATVEAARRHCSRAVLLVHVFSPPKPGPKLAGELAAAAADLDMFVSALSGTSRRVSPGCVIGPFPTHATEFLVAGVSLYIGKVETELTGPQPVVAPVQGS